MIVRKGKHLRGGGGLVHGLVAPLLSQLLHNTVNHFQFMDSVLSGTQWVCFDGTLFTFWRDLCYGSESSDDKCPMYYSMSATPHLLSSGTKISYRDGSNEQKQNKSARPIITGIYESLSGGRVDGRRNV